jgi:Fe-S-cluster containining protein
MWFIICRIFITFFLLKLSALKVISDLSFLAHSLIVKENNNSFGWMSGVKKIVFCHFLEAAGLSFRCLIYDLRPALCQTYPFYMEDCKLHTSECKGLGSGMSYADSLKLARLVLDRYIHELEERILVYQCYEHFEPLETNVGFSLERFKKGHVVYIVHDSEGAHRRCERM